MTNPGSNNCPYIITRGENRVCNKSCRGQYCSVHMKLIRAREGRSIIYRTCSRCNKLTRSQFNMCYKCSIDTNIRYQSVVKGGEIIRTNIGVVQ